MVTDDFRQGIQEPRAVVEGRCPLVVRYPGVTGHFAIFTIELGEGFDVIAGECYRDHEHVLLAPGT